MTAFLNAPPIRDIKYRVWDKRDHQMKPVANISFGDDGSARTIMVEPAPKGKYYSAVVHGENGILLQYTGLKDKNDKEIYQGDIVQLEQFEMGVVAFAFGQFTVNRWGLNNFYQGNIEIIGNVYEHPELVWQS